MTQEKTITFADICRLDERIERLEDRLDRLTDVEQTEYRALKRAMVETEIAYYAQGARPSPYSLVTMTAAKHKTDDPNHKFAAHPIGGLWITMDRIIDWPGMI